MDKLYQQIVFSNNQAPALNETNLNAISKAINDIDDRVIEGFANAIIAGQKAELCEQYAESAQTNATASATSASSASASAESASASAELASSTVSDLSNQFQECLDALDEIIGG